jgi:hypothetical protein
MKRLRTILFFVALGALLNVAVAWAICNYSWWEWSNKSELSLSDCERHWFEHVGPIPGGFDVSGQQRTTFGWTMRYCEVGRGVPSVDIRILVIDQVGWPMRSLWSYDVHRATVRQKSYTAFGEVYLKRPAVISFQMPGRGYFPYYVEPSGMLINTVFYAIVLFILAAARKDIQRRCRRARGRCIQCAYDLHGGSHTACPECGHTV